MLKKEYKKPEVVEFSANLTNGRLTGKPKVGDENTGKDGMSPS